MIPESLLESMKSTMTTTRIRSTAGTFASLTLASATLLASFACTPTPVERESFDVVEATITEMQDAMADGRITARDLVEAHLLRIAL